MLRVLFLLLLELSSSLSDTVLVPFASSVTLPCVPDNTTTLYEAKLSWSFPPALEGHFTQADISGPSLTLVNVQHHHEGTYRCDRVGWKGENRIKQRKTYRLVVEEPSSTAMWQVIKATAGDFVMLPCLDTPSASASPPRPMSWSREQAKPRPGEVDATDWSLQIEAVTEEDADMYSCIDNSSITIKSVELIVEPAPTPPPARCLNQSLAWEPCVDESSRSWGAILGESLTGFSMKLYSELRRTSRTENLLLSPLSIAGLLSHLLLGARGETRKALEDALSLPDPFHCLHSQMRLLREEVKESVEIASQIYFNPVQKLGEAFVSQSQEFYDTVPEKLTNDSARNTKMINDWVSQKTHGKIPKLVDSVDTSAQLMLLNAVYFNGKWKVNFEKQSKNAPFVTLSGDMLNVPVLYSSNYKLAMQYEPKLKAQIAMLPLTGKNSLFILLPASTSLKDLEQVELRMTFENIRSMVESMKKVHPQVVKVTLPKLKLDLNTDMLDLLDQMGLSVLFDSPNLCGLFPEDLEPQPLSDARHRASLTLSEVGVEAGAATTISFARSLSSFSALQPFVLLLWSDQANCPLFMGRVTNPQ